MCGYYQLAIQKSPFMFPAFIKFPILTTCVQVVIPACTKSHNSAVVEICFDNSRLRNTRLEIADLRD